MPSVCSSKARNNSRLFKSFIISSQLTLFFEFNNRAYFTINEKRYQDCII